MDDELRFFAINNVVLEGTTVHYARQKTAEVAHGALCAEMRGARIMPPYLTTSSISIVSCQECLEWLHA